MYCHENALQQDFRGNPYERSFLLYRLNRFPSLLLLVSDMINPQLLNQNSLIKDKNILL